MNDKNNLIGMKICNKFIFIIEILEINKEVPDNEVENLKEWVLYKGIELGTGRHLEHYGYTSNFEDDIAVLFIASIP